MNQSLTAYYSDGSDCPTIGPDCPTIGPDCPTIGPDCECCRCIGQALFRTHQKQRSSINESEEEQYFGLVVVERPQLVANDSDFVFLALEYESRTPVFLTLANLLTQSVLPNKIQLYSNLVITAISSKMQASKDKKEKQRWSIGVTLSQAAPVP